ncbi:MAG TPA: histidine kinase, partial [Gemmatimonadaceae bacterium]
SHAPTSALLLRANVDRLVAGGRVVLAAIAFVAMASDGAVLDRWHVLSLFAVGAYLFGAIAQLAIVMRTLHPRRTLTRIEFVVDATFIGAVALLTGGASATLFSFFVFFIVATGLRRSPRVVAAAGVAGVCIFLGATATSSVVRGASALDLHQLVVRAVLLALCAVASTIFAVERERLFSSLASMASWPLTEWSDLDAALFGLLGVAADLAVGSRVALVWADSDEPWTNIAVLEDELSVSQVPPRDDDRLQHIEAEESFICARLTDRDSIVTRLTAAGVIEWEGAPLSPELLDALSPTPRSIVGVPVNGQIFSGHLLILDWDKIPSDFVLRAEIVARQIATSLDIWMLSRRARDLAAREERGRVWRDLHDGVLQSLTGLALMLARAEQMMEADAGEARRILREAATLVHDEQRDLRLSILEQKAAASSTGTVEDLHTLLAQLVRRFEQVWGMRVDMEIDPSVTLGPGLSVQITRMIQEALSNSARHGQSTHAKLRVRATEDGLLVTVEDNGKGFPFVGTFSHSMLLEQRIGPILLKDRVQRLQGTLDIRSARTGVGLDIRIPTRTGRLAG